MKTTNEGRHNNALEPAAPMNRERRGWQRRRPAVPKFCRPTDRKMDVVRLTAEDQTRIEECARMMVNSEPWITLRRSLGSAMGTLLDPRKEVYAVVDDQNISAFIILELRARWPGYMRTGDASGPINGDVALVQR